MWPVASRVGALLDWGGNGLTRALGGDQRERGTTNSDCKAHDERSGSRDGQADRVVDREPAAAYAGQCDRDDRNHETYS